ncbi:MAG: integrin alpha, partial [Terriglobia bacterium]
MCRIPFAKMTVWTGLVLLILGAFLSVGSTGAGLQGGHEHYGPVDTVAQNSTPSDDWFARVTEQIRRSEYHFSRREDGSWSAPNRAHGLRARLDEAGLRVSSRAKGADPKDGGWELQIVLSALGREGNLSTVQPAVLVVEEGHAEFRRGTLAEWYINDEKGLEQGFTIDSPPRVGSNQAPVILEMALGGNLLAYPNEDGQSILFKTAKGEESMRYAGLKVSDARGNRLEAWLGVLPQRLQIWINDDGAAYPLTIDPLLVSPAWMVESNQGSWLESPAFGYSVATAGDVDGDGFSDVIVGAYLYDNGQTDEGRVFLYLGSTAGLSMTPAWTAESDQASSEFGYSVSTAGDVNGDGFSDVIVGAYRFDTVAEEGRVFVWHGSSSGLGDNGTPGNADWIAEGGQTWAWMGTSVATAGDVNGDGVSDVIIGAPVYDNDQVNEGRAFVWYGSSGSGLGLNGTPSNADWLAEGDQTEARLGTSVATAGDVNGDGVSDIIVGGFAYNDEGRAFVWHGSSGSGLGQNGTPSNADWSAESNQVGSEFGSSVATAGDVNGDGFSDVIIGAYWFDNPTQDEGRVFVWHGGSNGLGANGTPNNADWTAESNQGASQFGFSVATAGDVNGDGFGDVIIGAPAYTNGQTNEGRAFAYHGSASGLSTLPSWTAETNNAFDLYGTSVATAGDVNGDGFSDVIVGAPGFTNGQNGEGAAFAYHGSAGGLATSSGWTKEGDLKGAQFGTSVATAGDVNGDGFSDVIVGAPLYDAGQTDEGRAFLYIGSTSGLPTTAAWTAESNHVGEVQPAQFGQSVGTAGDVNGDGFSDVIVGAPGWDKTVDLEDAGRAFVWYGSASAVGGGLGENGTPTNADRVLEPPCCDELTASFGWSVGTAGDVNGDGFSDVIVGSYQEGSPIQPKEGRARVYHGGASGLSASPAWTGEGDQGFMGPLPALFGWSVATAGDVNGDGFSDVIVGAPGYDNGHQDEGRVFVYLGSSQGLPGGEFGWAWAAESDQVSSQFGYSVATAGDVNGDGF